MVGRTAGGIRSLERQMVNSSVPDIYAHIYVHTFIGVAMAAA